MEDRISAGLYLEMTDGPLDEYAKTRVTDVLTGYHFRRSARPAQGQLTGSPTIGLSLVLISPRDPADAQALRIRYVNGFRRVGERIA